MTPEEAKQLDKHSCYIFRLIGHGKKKIKGIPLEVTIIGGWNFYAGSYGLKIQTAYRKWDTWWRSKYCYIVPLSLIKSWEFVEDGF